MTHIYAAVALAEDLTAWTPDRVRDLMKAAFQARQKGRLAAEVLTWPAKYVMDGEARDCLLWWAAIQGKAKDISVGELCREKGWPRSSFDRKWREACDVIAATLNAEGIPVF